jgi:hypothetical protein
MSLNLTFKVRIRRVRSSCYLELSDPQMYSAALYEHEAGHDILENNAWHGLVGKLLSLEILCNWALY